MKYISKIFPTYTSSLYGNLSTSLILTILVILFIEYRQVLLSYYQMLTPFSAVDRILKHEHCPQYINIITSQMFKNGISNAN